MSNKSNKKMGLFSAMMILVGSVIGSGIFMTPGKVAAAAGSIGPTIIAWVAAGACGILCALVYAELAPMMPKAGGAYVFIREALGDGPAFAYGWSMTFGSFLPVIAMLATAFCTNLAIFFPGLTVTGQRIVGTVIILALMVANLCGVKFGSLIQNIFTVGKLGALALVIFGGLFVLEGGNFLSMTTETVEWGNSLNAAVPALLAFGGYYTLAYMSEEIDNPKRNLPLATIFGMGIVILVNVLLNLSCIGAVGFKELAGADTPVSMAAMTIFGPIGAAIVTLGALISIFGSLNGAIMGPPRVVYAMSKENMPFGFFSKLHPKFNTPYITLIIFGVVAIFFLWTGSFMTLLMMGTFVSRLLECIVALSLIVLRKKKPDAERPFKMWGYPVTAVLTILITGTLVCMVDPTQILHGLLLMATSIPAYLIFKHTLKKKAQEPAVK